MVNVWLYINHNFGGFNHLEKYDFVNGKDDIPYIPYIVENKKMKPTTKHI
jgi:hypothetical protein